MRRVVMRLGAAASMAVLVLSLGAGSVFAGEVNGAGTKFQYSQGRSFCKFSGLNDKPLSTNPFDPGGRVQSYGYSFVRNGLKGVVPSPAIGCNPNAEFEE